MNYKINYSKESRRDLDEIWDYIAFELSNPPAAEHTVSSILDAADKLKTFPEMGKELECLTQYSAKYRRLRCGNYMVFYRILDKSVYIDRVIYARRDYMSILFDIDD